MRDSLSLLTLFDFKFTPEGLSECQSEFDTGVLVKLFDTGLRNNFFTKFESESGEVHQIFTKNNINHHL